jgi:phosphoribosyl 1,2-cyclic phosphate 1,2-diphosphodiesterase
MKADLHVHSRCSDGSYTVEEVVHQGASVGLDLISVTDHDTVEGCDRLMAAGKEYGIRTIPGIEISAYHYERQRKIHILGYSFRPEAVQLRQLCEPMLIARHQNSLRQIKAIADAGYEITEDEVRLEAGETQYLYKQHIMGVLIRKGYTDNMYSPLYKHLFKGNGPAIGDIAYVSCTDAVQAILADGGVPVLAHPGQQDSLDLVPLLASFGLQGIEINHPDHSPAVRNEIAMLAQEYGLMLTGGSDFHGAYGGSAAIGSETAPDAERLMPNG